MCERCCGTCRYNKYAAEKYTDEAIDFDWVCENSESEFYTDYIEYSHVCDNWEEKSNEKENY